MDITIKNLEDIVSNSFSEVILEQTNDLISIIDDNYKFEYINDFNHKELVGYDSSDLLGKFYIDFVHYNDIKKINKFFSQITNLNRSTVEIRLKHKTGNYIWVKVKSIQIEDINLKKKTLLISKVSLNYEDIEQFLLKNKNKIKEITTNFPEFRFWKMLQPKQCLAALEDSQTILNLILDNIPQYIVWKDTNSVYLGCNKTFSDFLKLPEPYYIIGKTDSELEWRKNDADKLYESEQRVITTESPEYHVLESWTTINGEEVWLDVNRIPIHDRTNKITGILVTYDDITDRKIALDELRESENKYRDLAELLPDTIYEADLKLNITYVNKAGFEKFGYTPEDLKKGINTMELVANQDKEIATKNIKEVLSRRLEFPNDYLLHKKDGTTFNASVHSRPIIKDGKVVAIRGVVQDTTQRKNAEIKLKESEESLKILNKELEQKVLERTKKLKESKERLEQQNEELKELDKVKGDFITMAAHELKTPLISIAGYIEFILLKYKETLDPEIINDINIVDRNTKRLQRLMNQLLDVLKLEEHKLNLEIERTNINRLIKESIDELGYQITEKNHELIFNMDQNLELNIDPTRFAHLITNLLSNAIKFTNNNGKIEILAKQDEKNYHFVIKDNGIGLTQDEIPRLFKKFEMVKQLEHKTGTGLGLYISKGIVELHGGKIWAYSEGIDKGTEIHFTIPL